MAITEFFLVPLFSVSCALSIGALAPYLMYKVLHALLLDFRNLLNNIRENRYYRTTYALEAGNSYEDVMNDSGAYGEFLCYKKLRIFERFFGARFLFNTYVPVGTSGGTTEIDIIMLCRHGFYVFESKNFAYKVTGRVDAKDWYEHAPSGTFFLQRD